jgi:hypothetical protein
VSVDSAVETLAGRVPDWVAAALYHAGEVVSLSQRVSRLEEVLAEEKRARGEEEERLKDVAARALLREQEWRRRLKAERAVHRRVSEHRGFVQALGLALLDRVIELPDFEFVFVRGSKTAIEKFREACRAEV